MSKFKSMRAERLECRRLLTSDVISSQLTDFSSFRSNEELELRDVQEGDFDGDGRVDIAGRHDGQWWVGRTDGSEFSAEHWATWSDVDWVDVLVADFNGDGMDDLAGRIEGDWWVATSTGERFLNQHWGRWSDTVEWLDVFAGDPNDDGMADIAGRTGGDWWVARSTGESFLNEYSGTDPGFVSEREVATRASAVSIVSADLNNDGTVGFDDFILLSVNYRKEVAAGTNGDLDGNAVVNFQDFLILSEQYIV